ncbi:hypothetical protein HK105_205815 [Polyrhizophydium stewartii]|uniref:SAGA-associated factor 11 n=1 Tax=Polyrhizophydium stewartii TaxID=2732419 RepID=A0ABR4N572_9FUNG
MTTPNKQRKTSVSGSATPVFIKREDGVGPEPAARASMSASGLSESVRESLAMAVWDDILAEFVAEIAFDAHRTHKLDQAQCQVCHTRQVRCLSSPGLDIFGANPSQTNGERYECANCQNQFPAIRFAPHLEKCLGLGRTSSRVASRKIASSERQSSPVASLGNDSDTDSSEKKRKRKPSPTRKPLPKKPRPADPPAPSQFKVRLTKPPSLTSGLAPTAVGMRAGSESGVGGPAGGVTSTAAAAGSSIGGAIGIPSLSLGVPPSAQMPASGIAATLGGLGGAMVGGGSSSGSGGGTAGSLPHAHSFGLPFAAAPQRQ